jgi:Plasmid pRiA4b ORF-3-like protein
MRILSAPCPIFQVKVLLRDVRPAIWRRILLRSDVSLVRLHKVIQVLMGWYCYHLYQYKIRGKVHAPPREDDDLYGRGESVRIEVSTVFADGLDNILYEYDFGDGWKVDVQLEASLPPSKQKWDAVCIDGSRRGPPEDCGGPHRYQEILGLLKRRTGEEYKEFVKWIGKGFDPEQFDVQELNGFLSASSQSSYERIIVKRFKEQT